MATMANAPREGLKQSLLLGFVALNVVLIVLVWVDNLSDQPTGGTGFVRTTPTAPLTHVVVTATPGPSATPTFTASPIPPLSTATATLVGGPGEDD